MASTEEQHQDNCTISPEPDVNFGSAPAGVTKSDGISQIAGTPEPGNADSPWILENFKDLSKNENLGDKNKAETDELLYTALTGNETIDKPQASFNSSSQPMQPPSSERSGSSRNCEIMRTYSTVSTPFLAGGELKLPNIFSAILKCATTLADSIQNWSQEIADQACDETKRLSLVQLNTAPESGIATTATNIASTSTEDRGKPLKTAGSLGAEKSQTSERRANSAQEAGFPISEEVAIKPATKQVLTTVSSVDVVPEAIQPPLGFYNKPQSLQMDEALTERNSFHFAPENIEDRGRKESKGFQCTRSASVLSIHPVASGLNLSQLKRNSIPDVPAGVAGFRNLCLARKTTRTQDSGINTHGSGSDKDFIDLFAEKNCVRFITVLEDIESHFKRRVASETETMPLPMVSESNNILMKIQALTKHVELFYEDNSRR
ncbi:unnamed protein product [Allacma fusca]|uniref:Uncharacterized protein n=1 Tax=Allacma fusca TaxID=39272 RepID=A0A8J2JNT8_9HEXA|nr:unnamed protein product [Allacma fusca]